MDPVGRRHSRLLFFCTLAWCLPVVSLQAQDAPAVTGVVVDRATGVPVELARVLLPGLGAETLSDRRGRFSLARVPAGNHELRVEALGYHPALDTVTVGEFGSSSLDVKLTPTPLRVGDMVVTGVAERTPRSRLPFTVERIDLEEIATPLSVVELIQSRVPGVAVVGSGMPGTDNAGNILLRGPTTVAGSNRPLIIVDGVITRRSLSDIGALDVESVEILKGAAAASFYGSRASAGVIQITTRRGRAAGVDDPRITLRADAGIQQVGRTLDLPLSHPYRMNAEGTSFVDEDGNEIPYGPGVVLDGSIPEASFRDNPFPGPTFDQMERFFDPGPSLTGYVSVEGRTGGLNYMGSFTTQRQTGIVTSEEAFRIRGGRLNLDHRPHPDLTLSLSTYFAESVVDEIAGNAVRDIGAVAANIDLLERDENGELLTRPDPLSLVGNPLVALERFDVWRRRQRILGSARGRWAPADWFALEGRFSLDRENRRRWGFFPADVNREDKEASSGRLVQGSWITNDVNVSLDATLRRSFGSLHTRSRVRWLMEDAHDEELFARGENLLARGVPVFENVVAPPDVTSGIFDVRSEALAVMTSLDFDGRYVGDFLYRRDGSSLFGEDDRWHDFYRASLAWLPSEEPWWPLDAVDHLKLRYSLGTSGGRPPFRARYETYAIDANGLGLPEVLGNERLRPELSTEQEVGVDATLLSRVSVGVVHSRTEVDDLVLQVPLPRVTGFESQWQNAGSMENRTWEAYLQAVLLDRPDLGWTASIAFDRTRSRITHLERGEWRRGSFIVREGLPLGTSFLPRLARSCAELPSGADCSQFDVNDDGYLVWVGEGNSYTDGMRKDLWGTRSPDGRFAWGIPFAAPGEFVVGDSEPDFRLSWSTSLRWRDLSLSGLFDWEEGADAFNIMKFVERLDQRGKPDELKKPVTYYDTPWWWAPGEFLEDASYMRFRQASLSWSVDGERVRGWTGWGGLDRLTLRLTGRNLYTWTDYSGYDPEAGASTPAFDSAVLTRLDNNVYPNFRTWTFGVEAIF